MTKYSPKNRHREQQGRSAHHGNRDWAKKWQQCANAFELIQEETYLQTRDQKISRIIDSLKGKSYRRCYQRPLTKSDIYCFRLRLCKNEWNNPIKIICPRTPRQNFTPHWSIQFRYVKLATISEIEQLCRDISEDETYINKTKRIRDAKTRRHQKSPGYILQP